MSVAEAGEHRHEIIIVRHGHGDHDEGHHGGVWKIAFADFMTAMMCFFLVMWLINAANEQTRAAVASYFNPIKLMDRNASRKGLEDLGDGPRDAGLTATDPQEAATKSGDAGKGNAGSAKEQNEAKDQAQKQQPQADQAAQGEPSSDDKLFADPYAMLSEIAADTSTLQNVSEKGDGGAQAAGPATGASGGKSYRDPFAPDFWSQQVATPLAQASAQRARIEGDPARPGDKAAETALPKVKAAKPALEAAPLEPLAKDASDAATKRTTATATARLAQTGEAGASAVANSSAPVAGTGKADKATDARMGPAGEAGQAKAGAVAAEARDKAPGAATEKAADEVRAKLAQAFQPGDKLHDGVSVRATDKGVVISITDQLDFGMFEIGSAVPSRELVLAMDKIGAVINAQKGAVTIAGHTDARPFRSAAYDNWRLSTARAQAAYYMLVRGGVDEQRIREVAGFADRQPRDASDPLAAQNRRIEILVETGG